jgi:hypothetical protein
VYLVYNDIYRSEWKLSVVPAAEEALQELNMVIGECSRLRYDLNAYLSTADIGLAQVYILINIYDPAGIADRFVGNRLFTAIEDWGLKGLYVHPFDAMDKALTYYVRLLEHSGRSRIDFIIGSDNRQKNIELMNALKRGLDFFTENLDDDRVYYFRDMDKITAVIRRQRSYRLDYFIGMDEFEKWKGETLCKRA